MTSESALASVPQYTPVSAADRVRTVDVLRGCALLGILLMNILTFGLPQSAYFNPRVAGGDSGPNLWAFILQYVFFDGRMRGIFSLMFGVSVYLMVSRAEASGRAAGIADIHYRRMMWLMLFGITHAFLIWFGDILYPYALLGLILFPLRKLSPKALLIVAGIQILLLSGMQVGQGFDLRSRRDKALEADRLAAQGKTLTDEQKEAQKKWKDVQKETNPPKEELKKELDAYRGNYITALQRRAKDVIKWHSIPYYSPFMWDLLALMLIGIALFKTGVITGERSYRFYLWMAAVGLAVGLPTNIVAIRQVIRSGYEPISTTFLTSTYQVGRVTVTLAYVAVLAMVVKSGALGWLTARLQAVGQMAFSNYITHSVVCSLIFYGYGLKQMGQLQRYQLYLIVLAIWTFQIIVSPIWLRNFHFGPLEWCWRSLTYWKRQPMRIKAPEPVAIAAEAQA